MYNLCVGIVSKNLLFPHWRCAISCGTGHPSPSSSASQNKFGQAITTSLHVPSGSCHLCLDVGIYKKCPGRLDLHRHSRLSGLPPHLTLNCFIVRDQSVRLTSSLNTLLNSCICSPYLAPLSAPVGYYFQQMTLGMHMCLNSQERHTAVPQKQVPSFQRSKTWERSKGIERMTFDKPWSLRKYMIFVYITSAQAKHHEAVMQNRLFGCIANRSARAKCCQSMFMNHGAFAYLCLRALSPFHLTWLQTSEMTCCRTQRIALDHHSSFEGTLAIKQA